MESIGDARRFLSAAREVALTKPIIVIKAGRTAAAAKAAASHTGSLTGSDEVLDAAFRRVRRAARRHIADLFNMAEVLAKQPRPAGPAPDDRHQRRRSRRAGHRRPDRRAAASWPTLSGEHHRGARTGVAAALEPRQPDRHPRRCRSGALCQGRWRSRPRIPSSDGLLVILTPQAMTDPTAHGRGARAFAKIARQAGARKLDGRRRRSSRARRF